MNFTEQFIESVKRGDVPEYPPKDSMDVPSASALDAFRARTECTKRGMWAIVDKQWTKKLAKWIGDRKCLEVMAGAGWLSKALSSYGIDIIATDDFSWNTGEKQHKDMVPVHPIETLDAMRSVGKYGDRDILIVSWPPYDVEVITSVCEKWGDRKTHHLYWRGRRRMLCSRKFLEAIQGGR